MAVHRFTPTVLHNTIGSHAPALSIASGDTVIAGTADAHGFDHRGSKIGGRPNPMTGPFFIEGAVTICDCLADLAQDGSVNGGDLGMLLSAWGLTNAQGIGDANHDGLVNGEDLSIVLSSWGACP